MTRRLIAILLSLTLALSLGTAAFAAPDSDGNPFNDVEAGAYYYDAVLWAVDKCITLGTGETTFSPSDPCTRAQIVTFLWRAAGSPDPTVESCPFTDVKDDAYYYSAVLWAVENGITEGTTSTTFSPDDICTRAQVVTFLYRYEGTPEVSAESCAFKDVDSRGYYYNALLWAVETGVTEGTSKTTFSPGDTCTRAQIVTFLFRALNGENNDPDPTEPTEAPTEPTEAPTEPTEAPTEPTEAPTEPTEAPTEPTEAPTEPTEAPTEPTEAPTEPTEAPEGFAVQLTAPQSADIWVYDTQTVTGKADVVIVAGQTDTVYARDKQGEIDVSGDGQVNFVVIPDEGWEVENVTAAGSYKNLKGPDETGTANGWRITKISAGDVVVTVTVKEESIAPTEPTEAPTEPTEAPTEPTEAPTEPTEAPTEPTETPTEPTEAPTEPTEAPTEPTETPTEPTEAPTEPTEAPEGFAVQLTAPQSADIWVYDTQTVTGDADVVIASGETGTVYARDKEGQVDVSGDGQVNFVVVPDEGWEVETVTAAGSYKNLKGPDETGTANAWRITKISAGDVVVTVTVKEKTDDPGTVTTGPTYFLFSDDGITVSGNTTNSYNVNGTALTISGEGTYYVSGSCTDGSIKVKKGTTDVELILNGLTLTSSDTAPITCNKSTEVTIEAAAGTVNTLTDSTYNNDDDYPDNTNAENAVIKCKDGAIVTLCGTGTINVIANSKNGVKGGLTTETEGTARLTVKDLTLNITCNANDGLKCDQELNILSGNITISAVDDGIKSDYVLNIGAEGTAGPTINVTKSCEGIEAATLNVYSGNVTVHATDDGMNAANGDLTGYSFALNVYGGTLYIDAANGDGLDSNGTMTLAGGTIEVHASSRNDNSPLDSDRTMSLTGGTVIAIGSNGMAQTPNSASQPYLSIGAGGMGGPGGGGPGGPGSGGPGGPGGPGGSSISISAGDTIVIQDASGNVLYSTTAVRAANYVFFSCASLVSGQTYTLLVNGTSAASVTAK